jgi:thermitase
MSSLAAAGLLTALAASPPISSAAEPQTDGSYAKGRILVMPRSGLPDAALVNILKEHGAGNARRISNTTDLRIVDLPAGQEAAVAARLARNPHIKFAELDMRVPVSFAVNDPYYGSQWHLPKIGAPAAWDTTQGNGVTVAILDTGIDSQHPDFAGRLVPGYNFVDGNTNVTDVMSHGTKTAGTAAAAMNNSIGVASVAGSAKIMPLRVADSTGYAYWSNMSAALTWASDHGAKVANMSFGSILGSSSVLSAAQYMYSRGGLVFSSAGNDNSDPGWANSPYVITVAATDSSDAKAGFSSYGKYVDLSAPGVGIYTTTWGQTYASVNGTSFSAPMSAAVAALVMSANPGLSNTQVEKILYSTAVDLGAAGRDDYFGYGRVDAAGAVAAARGTTSTVDSTAPTASISAPLSSATVGGLVAVDVSASDNVGVTKVELRANGNLVAADTTSPYGFSWDSTKVANGAVNLVATAYDAAGNTGNSTTVSVNVSNNVVVDPTPSPVVDATPPTVAITNPTGGSKVSGMVTVNVNASDNGGTSNLRQTLYIDGQSVASSTGGSLSYKWNTRKVGTGSHTIQAVATDAAGNSSNATETVSK